MPPEDYEEGVYNGVNDKWLEMISNDIVDIKGYLREHVKWQMEVTESLAAGNEKFRSIDGRVETIEHDVEKLEDRDRNLGILTVVLTTVAGYLGIKLNL